MKRFLSALLALATLLTLAIPAGATFPDISDPATQEDVAVLQMMGVVSGTSANTFSPNGPLTRAQFCRMAVVLLGRAEEEPLYRNRTIFPDVRANHWARGYINLAVSVDVGVDEEGKGGTKLIRGVGDGTFRPDRNITFAEAVTILLRMLGYVDMDAGMNWPKGYIELGAKIGLTKGMNLASNQVMTRAQAAHLFCAALTTPQKNGGAYYNTLGTATTDVVLLSGNATAEDGTDGAIATSDGKTYKTATGRQVPPELVGRRGTLITNEKGVAVAFIPVGDQKTITVGLARSDEENIQASWLTDRDGTRYQIPPSTPAYTTTGKTTYGELWMDIRSGTQVTLFYSAAGRVEGLYMSTATADTAMVARTVGSGNPFASLLQGASTYTIYRDGNPAEAADICVYDVGIYDPASRILSVSSAKLTGTYDNVWPNVQSPAKVTVLGTELKVMDMAIEEMAGFRLGDAVTLLLTADGQVAGAVSPKDVRSENIGVLESLSGEKAKVTLLNGLKLEGTCTSTGVQAGELVRVSSGGSRRLSLGKVSGSGVSGSFDVARRRIGGVSLSGSCRIFEKVRTSAMREIDITDLTVSSLSSRQVTYAHKDSAGHIDLVILENATGDLYTYGMLENASPVGGGNESISYSNNTVVVINADHPEGTSPVISNTAIPKDNMGGVAFPASGTDAAGVVTLTKETGVRRSDFSVRDDGTFVRLRSQEMRVSDEVQCYNAATKTWFASLADARAFSDNLTVYYDRPVQEGGKVRIVVAQ